MNSRFNYSLFITIVVVLALLGSFLFIAPAASSAERTEALSAELIRVLEQ